MNIIRTADKKTKEVASAVVLVSINIRASCRRFRIIRALSLSPNLRWRGVQTDCALLVSYPEPDGESLTRVKTIIGGRG
jgi:hypothetical protein